jgi:hypothetical protein
MVYKKPGAKIAPGELQSGLFLAMLLDVGLDCLISVPSGVNCMAPRCVSMVCGHSVFSGIVMLGGFAVVPCGMREML